MRSLWGRRVLVLEDEYFLAEEMERVLSVEGAVVIGPFAAMAHVEGVSFSEIDGAVLNVRVQDGLSYPLAQRLREYGIPFVFASGQDRLSEPKEWHDCEWVPKPYDAWRLIAALHRVMGVEP